MFDEKSHSLKMDKAIEVFSKELSSLRTSRANAAMLDLVRVDVYGQQMPIEQLATISVPEARLISIQVWDKANINLIESSIQKSEFGNANIISKEFLGDFLIYKVSINDNILRVRTNINNQLDNGDKCFLSINKNSYYFLYPGGHKVHI